LHIDTRWATANVAEVRRLATELVALAPDVTLAHGSSPAGLLLPYQLCFPVAADPVGAGLVDSLARPGGNTTGFLAFEYSLSGRA